MLRPCLLLVDTFHANPRTADGMPVRECRMHQKLKKNGLSFDAEITWWPIPIMTKDEHGDEKVEIKDWPMLLPSALARSLTSADLGEYLGPSGPECLQFWNTVLEDYDEESRQRSIIALTLTEQNAPGPLLCMVMKEPCYQNRRCITIGHQNCLCIEQTHGFLIFSSRSCPVAAMFTMEVLM